MSNYEGGQKFPELGIVPGNREYLSPEARIWLKQLLRFPEDLPEEFWSAIDERVKVNARITTGQIEGFATTWKDYVPDLRGSLSNPTLGTGAVQQGRYVKIGKTVCGVARIFVGTSGYVNGTGTLSIPLPVLASVSYFGNVFIIGNGWISDNSAPAIFLVSAELSSLTHFFLRADAATTVTLDGAPFIFANNDDISVCFTYEAA